MPKNFIEKIAPYAIEIGNKNNIMPALIIAQGCLESDYGRSELGAKANNLFGIKKGSGWTGKVYSVITGEYDENKRYFEIVAEFRNYSDYAGCISDLCYKYNNGTGWEKHNRYEALIGETDYKKATAYLVKAGYATDPNYAVKLNRIIETYNLEKYNIKGEDKMVKIVLDAGHGFETSGKRTPDGEREWSFNNKVLLACQNKLNKYKNVQILRTDDPTGKTDIPLKTRTDKANAWGADVLVSIHHNANAGKWGSHGGVETYVQTTASQASKNLAALVQPLIVKAMGLRDRGVKTSNLHMTRESKMPAILTEGGFMDSTTDIGVMRNDAKLKAQGEAIADGLIAYFKLEPKDSKQDTVAKPNSPSVNTGNNTELKFSSPSLKEETEFSLQSRARRKIVVETAIKGGANKVWLEKLENGEITDGDLLGLSLKYLIDTNK